MKLFPAKLIAAQASPYPPSFGGNAILYAGAFAAVLSIAVFALIVAVWIGRHLWIDRMNDHPRTLIFQFRLMVLLVATAAFIRSFPEVVYMTCYGDPDISPRFLSAVLPTKRVMDLLALPIVTAWMAVLVSIYPFVVIALRYRVDVTDEVDLLSAWPRIARPVSIFALVIVIAILMAIAKGYGLQS